MTTRPRTLIPSCVLSGTLSLILVSAAALALPAAAAAPRPPSPGTGGAGGSGTGGGSAPAPQRRDSAKIPKLIEEAAGDLLLLADDLCNKGYLDAASRALAAAKGLVPGGPGAGEIEKAIAARRAAMPRPAPPFDTSLAEIRLSGGKSLKGWKKGGGKWEADKEGLRGDAGKGRAFIAWDRVPGWWSGFSFSFSLEIGKADTPAGVVLGRMGHDRVGVIFDGSGAALYDFKTRKPLGPSRRRTFPIHRALAVTVTVRAGLAEVSFQGKPLFSGLLEDWRPGEVGFFTAGRALFRDPRLRPLEADALIEKAREEAKKRNPVLAASLLLRAEQVPAAAGLEAGAPSPAVAARAETAGLLAGVLADLGYMEEAARRARAFLDPAGDGRTLSSEMRKMKRRAEKILAEAAGLLSKAKTRRAGWAAKILAAGEAALSAGGPGEELDAVAAALDAVAENGETALDFRARLFLSRCGSGEGLPLFDGDSLDGWTRKGGVWEAVEDPDRETEEKPGAAQRPGVLAVTAAGEGPAVLEREDLPGFDRYLLETKQRGTGSYLDQGVRFFVGQEPFTVRLFRFMSRQDVTVTRNGAKVLFRTPPGAGLSSGRWHAVDFLVHMNRLTVILDGTALFTKILPAPPERRIALVTGGGRRGHFKEILYRPLGRKGEYEALLAKLGVPLMEVEECENARARTSATAGTAREQPFAYNGRVLAGAVEAAGGKGKARGPAFRFKAITLKNAVLSIRYAAPRPPGRREGSRGEGAAPALERREPSGGNEGRKKISGKTAPAAVPPAAVLRVVLDGRAPGTAVTFPFTESANDFAYARAPLGDLSFGWHEVRLEPAAGGKRVLLDRLVLSIAADAPEEETKICDSEAAPHFRIRVSPGVRLPENSEEIFALLEVIRAYMVKAYGFEPADPLYFNLISRECWADPHKGGYASGDNLYIPEETTIRNIAVIMHELSHNFDHGMGFNPPWFGEGKSFPVYVRFTEETERKYRAFQQPFAKSDMTGGKGAFDSLMDKGENLLQYWGTKKFPYWGKLPDGRDLTSLGYRASNWLMYRLARCLGPGWIHDYFALLRREIAEKTFFMPRDRVAANSVIVDYFARSSGKKARLFFSEKRFKLVDIYDWTELAADCGDDEETYLTEAGPSTTADADAAAGPGKGNAGTGGKAKGRAGKRSVSAGKGRGGRKGGGKARCVTNGSFSYAFPVRPDTKSLSVTITRSGYGTCRAWEKRLFRGKAVGRGGWETRTFKLKDPALWAGSRLKLLFASEKPGDHTLKVARIVLRKE